MTNEIKVGDKVRVREDAPKIFSLGWYGCISNVVYIGDGCAKIECRDCVLVIPLKYLIKVEEEAKEAKFKRGDKVVRKPPFAEKVLTVLGYDDKMPYMVKVGDGKYINERSLEPYAEPTEDEIVRQREAEFNEFAKEELDRVHHPEKYTTHEVTIDNVAMDWEKYTADLAKEIAIVYAKQKRDVRMAVRDAKAVVEELKKK